MDRDLESKLYAAALYAITAMMHDRLSVEQRASLASEIVEEVARRKIVHATGSPVSVADQRKYGIIR